MAVSSPVSAYARSFDELIASVLAPAAEHLPALGDRLRAAGLEPSELTNIEELDRIPILTKDDLVEVQADVGGEAVLGEERERLLTRKWKARAAVEDFNRLAVEIDFLLLGEERRGGREQAALRHHVVARGTQSQDGRRHRGHARREGEGGLGTYINNAKLYLFTPQMFAALLSIAILGVAFELLFGVNVDAWAWFWLIVPISMPRQSNSQWAASRHHGGSSPCSSGVSGSWRWSTISGCR
jgi:hypothetical protein